MRCFIYGAGTIGIAYAWLLSEKNEVDLLVKPERLPDLENGIEMRVKDLRRQEPEYRPFPFHPHFVTAPSNEYDMVLVTVNRCQLKNILPELSRLKRSSGNPSTHFVFMQNNWDLSGELSPYFKPDEYLIAFPSSIGGGREQNQVQIILFDEATRLGGDDREGIQKFQSGLKEAGIKTQLDGHILDWLKVHYLQQSITAGAVLESGSYLEFANSYPAVRKMVTAFREGIAVCAAQGVPVKKTFPANLFSLPAFLVAHSLQKMFLEKNTIEMVTNHMKKGLPEWAAGYFEVLEDGVQAGIPMTAWSSYRPAVQKWLDQNEVS